MTSGDSRTAAAVEASGGTSDPEIKAMILDVLQGLGAPASILDFGAGKGELIGILRRRYPEAALTGFDYMPRPARLDDAIAWTQADLNHPVATTEQFEVVIASEVIEHLENPRQTLRILRDLLKPGATLILTMPNQESVRAYASLMMKRHFAAFAGDSYPAHITALLAMDLARICEEVGLQVVRFGYSNLGGLPKRPQISWQKLSFGKLKGRLFSDNLLMVATRP